MIAGSHRDAGGEENPRIFLGVSVPLCEPVVQDGGCTAFMAARVMDWRAASA